MRTMFIVLFTLPGLIVPAQAQFSMKCGVAPIPPLGCKIGDCVCDSNGNNCHWQVIC